MGISFSKLYIYFNTSTPFYLSITTMLFLKLIYDLIFNRNDYVYWVQFLSSMSGTMPSHL